MLLMSNPAFTMVVLCPMIYAELEYSTRRDEPASHESFDSGVIVPPIASHPQKRHRDARHQRDRSERVEDGPPQSLHAFALAGIVPHSGQRSGVARRS